MPEDVILPGPLYRDGHANFIETVAEINGQWQKKSIPKTFVSINIRALPRKWPDPSLKLPSMTPAMLLQMPKLVQWNLMPHWQQLDEGGMTLYPWDSPDYLRLPDYPKSTWSAATLSDHIKEIMLEDITKCADFPKEKLVSRFDLDITARCTSMRLLNPNTCCWLYVSVLSIQLSLTVVLARHMST
jgi:hypothetical protein